MPNYDENTQNQLTQIKFREDIAANKKALEDLSSLIGSCVARLQSLSSIVLSDKNLANARFSAIESLLTRLQDRIIVLEQQKIEEPVPEKGLLELVRNLFRRK